MADTPLGIQPQPQQPNLGVQPPPVQQPFLGVIPQGQQLPPGIVPSQQQLGVQPPVQQAPPGVQPPPQVPAQPQQAAAQAFEMPKIDPSQVTRVKARTFIMDVLLDGQVWRYSTQAMNLESLMVQMSVAISANVPRISGWNVYDEKGTLVMSVSAMDFIQQLAQVTPIGKQPADPKTAGWRAIPVVTPTSQEFVDAMAKAKKEGRIPT